MSLQSDIQSVSQSVPQSVGPLISRRRWSQGVESRGQLGTAWRTFCISVSLQQTLGVLAKIY